MEVYDQNAPLLVAQGYHPLPTAPADFQPAKAPVKWVPAYNKHVLFRGWAERTSPVLTPQPGPNIGVRCGRGLVAFDYDEEEAALVISEAFDPSPVNKAGQRAWTPFYRADFVVPSEDFFDTAGKKVLQVLSTGRQTVIPPSIHPDTNEPYRWTNGQSLYDTPLADLPLLPRDYRERIMALGYSSKKSGPEQAERVDLETGEIKDTADNEWRALNNAALKNLAAWVPDLNLYKCRRRVGRFPNYEAIATWRESSTGRPLEEATTNPMAQIEPDSTNGPGHASDPLSSAASWARAAGYPETSAKVRASELLADERIRAAVLEVAKETLATVGPVLAAGELLRIAGDRQHPRQLRALEMLANRTGLHETEHVEINHNVTLTGDALVNRVRELAEKLGLDAARLVGSNALPQAPLIEAQAVEAEPVAVPPPPWCGLRRTGDN